MSKLKYQVNSDLTNNRTTSERNDPGFLINAYLGILALVLAAGGISWCLREKVFLGNSDFTIFLTAARMLIRYPASSLYDLELQARVQREILGGYALAGGLLPFNHTPIEAFIFLPLGFFSYTVAFTVWLSINLALIFLLPPILMKTGIIRGQPNGLTIWLATLSFYPFLVCLWQGQDSILYLWMMIAFYLMFLRGQDLRAGIFLSLAFVKFHLVYLFVIPLIVKRRYRALAGLTAGLIVLTVISSLIVGLHGIKTYGEALLQMSGEGARLGFFPGKMQNMAGQLWILGFQGARGLRGSLVLALAGAGAMVTIWKIRESSPHEWVFKARFAASILVAILVSPHSYLHDLAPVFLSLTLSLPLLQLKLKQWYLIVLVCILLLSPLVWIYSIPMAAITGVQTSVILMSTLTLLLMKILHSCGDVVSLFEEGTENGLTITTRNDRPQ